MIRLSGTYFCGHEASNYAKENGYLDYATLAKAFDAVMSNDIMTKTYDIGYWEQESGFLDFSEEIEELKEEIEKLEDLITTESTTEEDETTTAKIDEINAKIEELEEEQDYQPEVYQWYIVSDNGAEILKEAGEIVFYNDELDMYLWGVTHCGTSWDYVLTNIPLNCAA